MNYNKKSANKYFSFDQSIHTTMTQFNTLADKNSRTIKLLHDLLNQNWVSKGYESIKEENRFKVRGFNMLNNYFFKPLDLGNENLIINKILRKKINKTLTLSAKIDKVIEKPDSSIEIIDYKTGNIVNHTANFPLDIRSVIYMLVVEDKLGIFPHYISYYYLAYNKKFTHTITSTDINPIYIDNLIFKLEQSFYPIPNPYYKKSYKYSNNFNS